MARVDVILEILEILPRGIRRFTAGSWRVDRRFDQLHGRNVTWTVRKDRPRGDTDDELCAHCLNQERILVAHCCLAIDAKALRLAVHGYEQHSNAGIDQNIAQTFKHAVSVVIGECKLGRPDDAHEARHAAFIGAIRLSPGICRCEEEIRYALDEGLVVGRKLRARALFQSIGNSATAELVLQPPVPDMIHDALDHRYFPWQRSNCRNRGRSLTPRYFLPSFAGSFTIG